MFGIFYRNLQNSIRTRQLTRRYVSVCVVLQCQNPHLKSISSISESKNPPSITVDYLINSCGLSPETALVASKKVRLKSREKADSFLTFFQNHGLSKTQIALLISKRPALLSTNPDKFFKPKIEFLNDLGVSGPNLAKIIVSDPTLLTKSLNNQIIPSFNFLKNFFHSTDNILAAFKRSTSILQCNLDKVMRPNIEILLDHGVPNCIISKLFLSQPRALLHNIHRFKEIVEMVKKMGFNSSRPMFIHAVRAMTGMSKLNWERKLAVYRSLGLSEDEILAAFKRQPYCMLSSKEKILKAAKFFMEKLKWKPAYISLHPEVLRFSLEKRVIPRFAVLKILYSKGWVRRRKFYSCSVIKLDEKKFLEKYVMRYHETIPEVMIAYKGGIKFTGLEEVG